jgi:hypothetical protein
MSFNSSKHSFVEYRRIKGGDRVLVAIDKISFVEVADHHIIIHMDNGDSFDVHDSVESPWMQGTSAADKIADISAKPRRKLEVA